MNSKGKSRKEYTARINKVMDFIEKNLNEELPLDKIARVACFSPFHFHRIFSSLIIMDTKIEVKMMPEFNVVYCRHKGQFNQIGKAYGKLMKWAAPRGLLNFPETKTITVYHDDPSITAIEQVRQSACITVDRDVKVDGEIGRMKIKEGKYAVGHFEIDEKGFEKAWNTMCLWFTESGYQPGEGFPYELYYNTPEDDKKRRFILDICIPVRRL